MPLGANKAGLFGAAGAGAESTDTGLAAGGDAGSGAINIIEYVTISSAANATDFGDLTRSVNGTAGTSNGVNSRGIFGGGNGPVNVIDYVTISSAGNATDFGDLLGNRANLSACSNGTSDRGVWMGGGAVSNSPDNVIQYVTISSTGDASDFGDLTGTTTEGINCSDNATGDRGLGNSGGPGTPTDVIEYITISSASNATDFGDATAGHSSGNNGSVSNGTNQRGIFAGGTANGGLTNIIEYVTINSAGNGTDFGDLSATRRLFAGFNNGTSERGVFAGGREGSSNVDTIEYITISSTGNYTDFGNLTSGRHAPAGTDDAG